MSPFGAQHQSLHSGLCAAGVAPIEGQALVRGVSRIILSSTGFRDLVHLRDFCCRGPPMMADVEPITTLARPLVWVSRPSGDAYAMDSGPGPAFPNRWIASDAINDHARRGDRQPVAPFASENLGIAKNPSDSPRAPSCAGKADPEPRQPVRVRRLKANVGSVEVKSERGVKAKPGIAPDDQQQFVKCRDPRRQLGTVAEAAGRETTRTAPRPVVFEAIGFG